MRVLVDGIEVASAPTFAKLAVKLPAPSGAGESKSAPRRMNYAVNNDGDYFPRTVASFTAERTSLSKINDGQYWYHRDPPNRWTCAGSPAKSDSLELDFGVPRRIDTLKLYFLDDGKSVVPPSSYTVERREGSAWKPIAEEGRVPAKPDGRRANVVTFEATEVQRLRFTFAHRGDGRTGLTELEAWGDAEQPYRPAPVPDGDLAFNADPDRGFPKASASFSDRFGGVPRLTIDSKVNYLANPVNRWTCYGSPNANDWLEVDFGHPVTVSRVELAVYDDGGGVRAPKSYSIEYWDGATWRPTGKQVRSPEKPVGGRTNEVRFDSVSTSKIRAVFVHNGEARSGVSEIFVWEH